MDILAKIKSLKKKKLMLTATINALNHELETLEKGIREVIGDSPRAVDITPDLPVLPDRPSPEYRQEAVDALKAINNLGNIHEIHTRIDGKNANVTEEWIGKEIDFRDDAHPTGKLY